MSVVFFSDPVPDDSQLAELWQLLEDEYFDDAVNLAEAACADRNAPIEFFCAYSLALGELGYYVDAETIARTAIGFGEGNWRARHALAAALLHQGRFLGSLDTLGFYREPLEIYTIRAQVERMGDYVDSLQITLEDALDKNAAPAIQLYLAYLHHAVASEINGWGDRAASLEQIRAQGNYLAVWQRDAARHATSAYGEQLAVHVAAIQRLLAR